MRVISQFCCLFDRAERRNRVRIDDRAFFILLALFFLGKLSKSISDRYRASVCSHNRNIQSREHSETCCACGNGRTMWASASNTILASCYLRYRRRGQRQREVSTDGCRALSGELASGGGEAIVTLDWTRTREERCRLIALASDWTYLSSFSTCARKRKERLSQCIDLFSHLILRFFSSFLLLRLPPGSSRSRGWID